MADQTMDRVEETVRSGERLRRLGVGGYVVLSAEAVKSGLSTRYPIGVITGFGASKLGVIVRPIGQRTPRRFSAIFWEPAPNTLINHIRG